MAAVTATRRWSGRSRDMILPMVLGKDSAGDPLVDDVCADFQARSRLGQQKYGMKMTRDDLGLSDWLHQVYKICGGVRSYSRRLIAGNNES